MELSSLLSEANDFLELARVGNDKLLRILSASVHLLVFKKCIKIF
jgi:hypothetical protein